ncbi:MAG: hypothetical protein ABH827_04525 [bacterium]
MLKKNLSLLAFVFLFQGFFGAHDLLAQKRQREGDLTENREELENKRRKIERELQQTIIAKNGEMLFFSYNDSKLFSENVRVAHNAAFADDKPYTKDFWLLCNNKMIRILKKGQLKRFCHAIKDKDERVVSFAYGCFNQDMTEAGVRYLGTIPGFKKQGFAWQLILSIFDRYSFVVKISLDSSASAFDFYLDHGFVEGDCGRLVLTRNKAEEVRRQFEEKYKKNNK